MSSLFHYAFSGLNNDSCFLSEREQQNNHFGNYNIKNLKAERPLYLSTSQPSIFLNSQFAPTGSIIDDESKLQIESTQTNPRGRINLFARPFATVPFLGRGRVDIEKETGLLQGHAATGLKSEIALGEISHLDHRHYPLIDSIRESVNNPDNLIESVANENWVRGGHPTRTDVIEQVKRK